MTLPLRFVPAATADISGTRSWYEGRRTGLGEEFLAQLDESLAQVQKRPSSFMLVTKTVRRTTLRRFPYCVYFVMREHDVVVLAVLHGGRKPSAWQRRKAQ